MSTKYGVADVLTKVTLKNITTKKPELYLRSLNVSTTEITSEERRLIAGPGAPTRMIWEHSKKVMFNCEDGLISPAALGVLAGNTVATAAKVVHNTEILTVTGSGTLTVTLAETPVVASGTPMFVFKTDNLDGDSIGTELVLTTGYTISAKIVTIVAGAVAGDRLIVDYYYTTAASTKSVEISSNKFGGFYRLEGECLWRSEATGLDVVAKYTMPKIKIASAFNLTQGNTGDPSVFSFNMEAFPVANQMVVIDVLE